VRFWRSRCSRLLVRCLSFTFSFERLASKIAFPTTGGKNINLTTVSNISKNPKLTALWSAMQAHERESRETARAKAREERADTDRRLGTGGNGSSNGKMKRGRPTKLSARVTKRIVAHLEKGVNQKTACSLAKIPYSTLAHARLPQGAPAQDCARCGRRLLPRHADWKAASWLLEKGWPLELATGDRCQFHRQNQHR
jgi:hypothetical protein